MAISFIGWLVVGVGSALVIGGIINELKKNKWDIVSIGFLILAAFFVYKISSGT